ncbi:MAG: hypothetical protein R3A48_25455 [Polyangiales bacterium]
MGDDASLRSDAATDDTSAADDASLSHDASPADAPPTLDLGAAVDAVVAADAGALDVGGPPLDAPATDVVARCTRDGDCTGATFCNPAGSCVPLACSPGRTECVSPSRARECDGRGATFTERDCPGGCVLNVCMTAPTCSPPSTLCAGRCVSTATDAAHCGACGRACAAEQRCVAGVCANAGAEDFAVGSITGNSCQTVSDLADTGDDRGGIAIAGGRLIYNGDLRSGGRSADDLAGFMGYATTHDAMISDLSNEVVYLARNAEGVEFGGSTGAAPVPFTITQLARLDPATGGSAGTPITLRSPVVIYHDAGFFSGWGFGIIYSGNSTSGMRRTWYVVSFADGAVTSLPGITGGIAHHVCENGAWWGVAERVGGEYRVVHVRNNTTIGRTRVPESTSEVIATFTDLADICSITASPRRGRWYFHHEDTSDFAPEGVEVTGHCRATFTSPSP